MNVGVGVALAMLAHANHVPLVGERFQRPC